MSPTQAATLASGTTPIGNLAETGTMMGSLPLTTAALATEEMELVKRHKTPKMRVAIAVPGIMLTNQHAMTLSGTQKTFKLLSAAHAKN